MTTAYLLCAAFALSVAAVPVKEPVSVKATVPVEQIRTPEKLKRNVDIQQNKTHGEIPPALTRIAEKIAKNKPAPVMEPRSVRLGDSRCSGYNCPFDWYQYESRCYKVFDIPMPWIEAEKYCSYFGANLISIHNPGENQFVWMIMWETGYDQVWIGGHDAVRPERWLWSDGSIFYYNNGDISGWEHCIEIDKSDGQWGTQDCELSLPFVCGTRPDGPM